METNPLVTWKPSPGDSNSPESPDNSEHSNDSGMFHRVFAAMTSRSGGTPSSGSGPGRFFSRWNRRQVNGRHVSSRTPSTLSNQGRHPWWGTTGPVFESSKISGNHVQIPTVAPPTAPGEHKKMILSQTVKKLENISAEWSAKADYLFERFSGVCANVRNEAELRIAKLEDFTSNVYEFSAPIGLTVQMSHTQIAGWHNANLKYLQMDLQLLFQNLATTDSPISGLPGPRSLQIVLKLPTDPSDRNQIHPGLTREILLNPPNLIAYIRAAGYPMEFGIINTRTSLFDPGLWDREYKKNYNECLFHAMKACLFRDYVGDSIVHDTHTRLQRCKQASFVNGKYVVKRIEDFHSEFMLIVHEYDPKKPIPCNLAQVAFHNLTKKFQDKLIANHYKPPQETGSASEQYIQLAKLKEEALKVEKEFDQITDTVRSVSGVKRANPSTSAFTANAYLSAVDTDDFADAYEYEPGDNDPEEDMDMFKVQMACLASHLSVAEEAMRQASGERSPLKCWGCQSFPEYSKDCLHRFIDCPHRTDPRVHQAFQEKMKTYGNRNRYGNRTNYYGPSGQPPRKQPARAMYSPNETETDWSGTTTPSSNVAAFMATTLADATLGHEDRTRIAEGFARAFMATGQALKPTPATEDNARQAAAILANMGTAQPPQASDKDTPSFSVFMVTPILCSTSMAAQGLSNHATTNVPPPVCPDDWASSWRDSLPPPLVQEARSGLYFGINGLPTKQVDLMSVHHQHNSHFAGVELPFLFDRGYDTNHLRTMPQRKTFTRPSLLNEATQLYKTGYETTLSTAVVPNNVQQLIPLSSAHTSDSGTLIATATSDTRIEEQKTQSDTEKGSLASDCSTLASSKSATKNSKMTTQLVTMNDALGFQDSLSIGSTEHAKLELPTGQSSDTRTSEYDQPRTHNTLSKQDETVVIYDVCKPITQKHLLSVPTLATGLDNVNITAAAFGVAPWSMFGCDVASALLHVNQCCFVMHDLRIMSTRYCTCYLSHDWLRCCECAAACESVLFCYA